MFRLQKRTIVKKYVVCVHSVNFSVSSPKETFVTKTLCVRVPSLTVRKEISVYLQNCSTEKTAFLLSTQSIFSFILVLRPYNYICEFKKVLNGMQINPKLLYYEN